MSAFKGERSSHNADGESADFLGNLRDHGSRTSAGTTAQTSSNEDHISTFKHFIQFFG